MKKHLLKIGAICLVLTLAFQANAQREVTIYSVDEVPVIDGDDSDWADISYYNINQVWAPGGDGEQTVSMMSGTVPSFKMVWDETNIYVLVNVPDDDFYPSEESGEASWLSDKPELYFDVNATLVDGGGPAADAGHYQFAPAFMEDPADNHESAYTSTIVKGDDSKNYFVEYLIPLASLVGDDEVVCDGSRPIGFDITVLDLDEDGKGLTTEAAQRINFANDALVDETWNTMDYSAVATFSYDQDPGGGPISVKERASNVNVLVTNMVTDVLRFNVEVSNVQVYNTVGQVVATTSNVSNLSNGVYIVAVETANGVVANRFVKK